MHTTPLRISLFQRNAPEQGGLLTGVDPTVVNTNDPLRLWIIQLCIIVLTAQILAAVLRKINQPRVIAEVLGGIILGPTAFGRIPGFTKHIFPSNSIPFLSLTANIALVLFLFLVGLEINLSSLRAHARSSAFISLGGMILPFSIGSGMAKLIFNAFVLTDPSSTNSVFTHFLLFVGVAYSITAFPVLCRILSELKLLDTTVGVCVLSAGVGNDIVGWTLLALSVALVNATSGLTALYIILLALGWTVFMLFPVRILWSKLATYSNPSPGNPSLTFTTLTLMLVFASAWFTDVIGVHAIFGGFLAGLIVPRTGGLAISMMEKVEDLVGGLLLPLYFTLSGLSTNLGLINTGKAWAYTIGIIATAWFGKFTGASLGGRAAGFGIRESATIGSLMSCKGLVELIVLNVGLQAGILSTRVFSMFVLEALVLTFFTTPVVVKIYPPHLRVRAHAPVKEEAKNYGTMGEHKGKRSLEGRRSGSGSGVGGIGSEERKWKFTLVLDRLEHLPGMVSMAQLLRPPIPPSPSPPIANPSTSTSSIDPPPPYTSTLTALRLIELTDRTSAVMRSISNAAHDHEGGEGRDERESLAEGDAMLGVVRVLGAFWGFGVKCALEVTPAYLWAQTVREHAVQLDEDGSPEGKTMVVLGWVTPQYNNSSSPQKGDKGDNDHKLHVPGTATATSTLPVVESATHTLTNPFDILFKSSSGAANDHKNHRSTNAQTAGGSSVAHSQFLRSVFNKSTVDVALFVDQYSSASSFNILSAAQATQGGHSKIYLPFFGGPDDRLALEMVVKMCKGGEGRVRAHVVWIEGGGVSDGEEDGVKVPGKVYDGSGSANETMRTYESTLATAAGGGLGNTVGAFPDTIYGNHTTVTRLQSQTIDSILWERLSSPPPSSPNSPSPHYLSQISFIKLRTPQPIHTLLSHILHPPPSAQRPNDTSRLLVLLGRSRRMAVESHVKELAGLAEERGVGVSSEVRKTVGDVAAAVVYSGARCDLVVVQAGMGGHGGV